MDYGLNISTSGVLTSLYRMDVLSNNLANVTTAGFKADLPIAKQRQVMRTEDGIDMPSDELLERLGGGVHQGRNRIQFTQGTLVESGGELDCALQGDGFFVLRESSGQGGDRVRLTRNGRFAVDGKNRLVSADTGMPVMSANNDVLTINPKAPVTITADGEIKQGASTVGKLKVMAVPNTDALSKVGHSMFSAPASALQSKMESTARVRQHTLEQSTVDPLQATMQITNAAKAVESNLAVMSYTDRMMDRAINALGRPT